MDLTLILLHWPWPTTFDLDTCDLWPWPLRPLQNRMPTWHFSVARQLAYVLMLASWPKQKTLYRVAKICLEVWWLSGDPVRLACDSIFDMMRAKTPPTGFLRIFLPQVYQGTESSDFSLISDFFPTPRTILEIGVNLKMKFFRGGGGMGIGVKWPKKALECTICDPRIQKFSGEDPRPSPYKKPYPSEFR